MTPLPLALHSRHEPLGARFIAVEGMEVVASYGDPAAEHRAVTRTSGLVDLSARGRLVLLGADRQKMLNGQVTNNVKDLRPGQGCYAFLVNAKAKALADLNILALTDELLLDLEPGLAPAVAARLDGFIVADDVQVVDAAPHYGLLSVLGRQADRVIEGLAGFPEPPKELLGPVHVRHDAWGDVYLARNDRAGTGGLDFYIPTAALDAAWDVLEGRVRDIGGRPAGWDALEAARIEAGIPRYGADIDATNLPPETGQEARGISYSKGCYSGQEVIARIRTYGQVARALRGLQLSLPGGLLPERGTKLFKDGRDVGYLTSCLLSPTLGEPVALGYVRRECNGPGSELVVGTPDAPARAVVVPLPFVGPQWA